MVPHPATNKLIWPPCRCLGLRALGGHTRDVLCMQLGNRAGAAGPGSGQLLASGSADKTVRTWDVRLGGSCGVQKLHLKGMPYCLQVQSAGCMLCVCLSRGKGEVWPIFPPLAAP